MSCGKLLFQFLEALFALGRPFKLLGLLQWIGHRMSYLGEVFDELAIISNQSQETSDFCHITGLIPFFHGFNLGWVNCDTFS
jgi:hypothetical protein